MADGVEAVGPCAFYTSIVPLRVLPFLGGLLRKSKGTPATWGLDPGLLSIEFNPLANEPRQARLASILLESIVTCALKPQGLRGVLHDGKLYTQGCSDDEDADAAGWHDVGPPVPPSAVTYVLGNAHAFHVETPVPMSGAPRWPHD